MNWGVTVVLGKARVTALPTTSCSRSDHSRRLAAPSRAVLLSRMGLSSQRKASPDRSSRPKVPMPGRLRGFAARLLPCCGDSTLWRCSISSVCTPFLEGEEVLGPKVSAAPKAARIPETELKKALVEPQLPYDSEPAATEGANDLALLPPELLHQIFSFMGPRDIAAARLVCRQAPCPWQPICHPILFSPHPVLFYFLA